MDYSRPSQWKLRTASNSSRCTIRKVFGRLGQPLVQYKIGNGRSTFLWLDFWHPLGPLYGRFGNEVVYNLGRSLLSRVTSIIHKGDWRWPRPRNRLTQYISRHTPSNLKPVCELEDDVVWLPHKSGGYTANSAWESISATYPKPNWAPWLRSMLWGTGWVLVSCRKFRPSANKALALRWNLANYIFSWQLG